MIVDAKFTGEDSLGYEHGKYYTIYFFASSRIIIMRMDNEGYCLYKSLKLFLKNWEIL